MIIRRQRQQTSSSSFLLLLLHDCCFINYYGIIIGIWAMISFVLIMVLCPVSHMNALLNPLQQPNHRNMFIRTGCQTTSTSTSTTSINKRVLQQSHHQQQQQESPWTTIRKSNTLYLSSSSSSGESKNDPTDDELSKLIGKREQIKRNVKKRVEEQQQEEGSIQPNTTPTGEAVIDLDLDKLPEFKTERPIRSSTARKSGEGKQQYDNDDDDGNNDDQKKGSAPIIDYMVEYEDENELHIPNRIGISTICWGDASRNFVSGKNVKLSKNQIKRGMFVAGDVQLAYQELLAAGIVLIETSPSYGSSSRNDFMSAEQLLGRCIQQHPSDLPNCMVLTSSGSSAWKSFLQGTGRVSKSYVNSLEQSLNRLSGTANDATDTMSSIDIFAAPKSLLFPTSLVASGLASQIESGQANYVGIQGMTNGSKLRKLCRILKDTYDTSLTTNTFEFSLTNTKNEEMIQICKDNNVIPLISNPLDDGLASGIYTATNPSGGGSSGIATKNNKFRFQQLEKLQPLHSVQETLTERVRLRVSRSINKTQERYKSKFGPPPKINTDITTTQIAYQYIIAKGGVPLAHVNTPKDAQDVIGCLGWTLTEEEVDMLDSAIALCKI